MIDEKKILSYIQTKINPYGKPFEGTVFEFGCKLMEYVENMEKVEVGEWIPVSERLPENEQEVEISCKRTYIASGNEEKTAYFTARAFYIDGKMNTEDSRFSWWDSCYNWEYDAEKDAFIIPEGWWEYVTFSEEFGAVDAEVLAWKPLTDPFKGE